MDYHTANGTTSRPGRQESTDDGQESYMDEVESGEESEHEAQGNEWGKKQIPADNTL